MSKQAKQEARHTPTNASNDRVRFCECRHGWLDPQCKPLRQGAFVYRSLPDDTPEEAWQRYLRLEQAFEAMRVALRLCYENSVRRSETRRKWSVGDQAAHEAARAALALAQKVAP